MRVKSEEPISTVYNLAEGTVFRFGDEYYIKSTEYDCTTKRCLCVNLKNGEIFNIRDTTVVSFYDAEVILNERN